jgi:spermidine/putrescine transport system permease protein
MSISKKRKRQRMEEFIGTAYSIAIYAILYIPVLVMMMFSFNNQRYNYYWNGFTTQWYTKLFSNSALIESLWYSVVIAVLATIISVTIGTIGALGLKKYEFRGKKFINEMLYIPIIVPEIVMAVALLVIFLFA